MHDATRNLLTALADLHAHREWLADGGDETTWSETIGRVQRVDHTLAVWADRGCPDAGESDELEGPPVVQPPPPAGSARIYPDLGEDLWHPWAPMDPGVMPVSGNAYVHVMLRNGMVQGPQRVDWLRWERSGHPTDIVAWRAADGQGREHEERTVDAKPATEPEGLWHDWSPEADTLAAPPVRNDELVVVRYRDGSWSNAVAACRLRWDHRGHNTDIVAWRWPMWAVGGKGGAPEEPPAVDTVPRWYLNDCGAPDTLSCADTPAEVYVFGKDGLRSSPVPAGSIDWEHSWNEGIILLWRPAHPAAGAPEPTWRLWSDYSAEEGRVPPVPDDTPVRVMLANGKTSGPAPVRTWWWGRDPNDPGIAIVAWSAA